MSSELHALVSLFDAGSAVTACEARWPIADAYSIWPVDPAPLDQRCETCERAWIDQRFVERGLRELIDSTQRYARELEHHSPTDRAGFELWLGPCAHGQSPITRCALGCAPQDQESQGGT